MKRTSLVSNIFVYTAIVIGAFLFGFPVYWMIRTALVSPSSIFSTSIHLLPTELLLTNFTDALTALPFGRYFINTVVITIINIIGVILTSSMCAYAFSRVYWPGRDKVFGVMMTALMLPFSVLMIPHFIGWNALGLTDSIAPLTIPAFFGGGLFNIFLLRQFFFGIPKELDEAALVDGSTHWRIYWSIILPLSKQALIVVGLFTFLATWNDYLPPMIYLSSDKKFTLMLGLNQFMGGYNAQWNLMMAAATVVVIPSIILYLFAQKHFIEGIAMTGVKG